MVGASIAPFESLRLTKVLRGIRTKVGPNARRTRLPLTIWLALDFLHFLNLNLYDDLVFCTAVFVGICGLLRASEFVCKSPSQLVLTRSCVTWYDDRFTILLKRSKVDVFGTGCVIQFFRTNSRGCPFVLLRLLWNRSPSKLPESALFQNSDGSPFSYSTLHSRIKCFVSKLCLDPAFFGTHSLRIGGATTLAALGVPPYVIQTMGRWSSLTYQLYTRVTPSTIRHAMRSMLSIKTSKGAFGGLSLSQASNVSLANIGVLFSHRQ